MNDLSGTPALQVTQARELHKLVRNGNIALIHSAIEAGADPDVRDSWGVTPLLAAVQHRRIDVIRLLGRAGADPDLTHDRVGHFTPLHESAWRNNLDSVEVLLELGADATKRT